MIFFDGYPTTPTTNDETHMRRSGGKSCTNIDINDDHMISVSKSSFLANKSNSQTFIKCLSNHLMFHDMTCHHTTSDADRYIVIRALEEANTNETVVHAEDTDILVLLLHMTTSHHKRIRG